MSPLDPELCYRALLTRDARFDGRLFVGVTSTGIYCRPVCPARTPRQINCRFFPSAAAAMAGGFRPCLRCKPLDLKRPTSGALDAVRDKIKADPERRWRADDVKALGYDPSTVRRASAPSLRRRSGSAARPRTNSAASDASLNSKPFWPCRMICA